jgi:hypothetical protein
MEQDISFVVSQAQYAGMQAMQETIPVPMVVNGGGVRYHVPSGACGFAWVNVYGVRSNSKVGKALIAEGFSKSEYHRCLQYWVHEGNQSVELKEAYAMAFAKVLQQHGINAYADSKLD